jgi:opacity protein-like surface antigen
MRRLLASILIAACLAIPGRAESADAGISVGRPVSVFNVLGGERLGNLNTRLGVRFERFFPFATIDYARLSQRTSFASSEFETRSLKLSLLTVGAGLRYHFEDPTPKEVVPFVVAEGFTAVPSVDRNRETSISIDSLDRASSVGFLVGGGASFYVTETFAVSGEVGTNGFFLSFERRAKETKVSILQVYASLQLSFYL